MCAPDVVIRPYRARQENSALEYKGLSGVGRWVASLDEGSSEIRLELFGVRVIRDACAVVEADVWRTVEGARRGGLTFSVWRFSEGRLREATGYSSRDEALAAAGVYD